MVALSLSLAAAAFTVLICTASITAWPRNLIRKLPVLGEMIECPFCTSWWVCGALVWDTFGAPYGWEWVFCVAAVVTLTNIFILLIHLSMLTVAGDNDG